MKSRDGKSQRREEKRRRKKIREEKEREGRKKMQVREKVGKSRFTVFVQWFVAQEGRKVGSLKRRVRSHLGRWEMNNCTSLWREAHLEVKMCKTHHSRTTFGSWDVEKVHAIVARSTFPSQSVQMDHFSKLRCQHVSKPKVEKTEGYGALLGVEMSFCVAVTRYSAPCQKWAVAVSTTTTTTLHSTPLHYSTLHYTTTTTATAITTTIALHLHYITLHYTNYNHNYYYNYN